MAYRFQYNDGLKATMLLMNGLVGDFTFAARLKGRPEPLSTLFYLPPNPNVVYSAALMSKFEEMLRTGRAPYPVERTLLTSGLVEAGINIIEAMDLDGLSAAGAQEFVFVLAHLNIHGATGAPARPLALA